MSKVYAGAGLVAALVACTWFALPARAESIMKECGAEWQTAKTSKTTNGQTWPEFLKDCKTRHASTTAAAPAPVATPTPVSPAVEPVTPAPIVPKPTPSKMAKVMPAATGAGQFTSEGDAKGHCPTDTVVWVNTKSHKYHFAGHHSYGATKQGAYMCEADAKTSGDIAAKGEKPKS